jgi:hypothetical protein
MEPNAGRFQFTDRHGHVWDTTLTLGGVNRVDASDFAEVFQGETCLAEPSKEFLTALVSKNSVVAAVVWALVQPQVATRDGFTELDFIEALHGPALEAMKQAFWGSLCDFFPDLASGLLQMIQTHEHARKKVATMMTAESETLRSSLDAMLETELTAGFAQLKSELGIVSTSSAPPPASRPKRGGRSRSASS